MAHELTTPNGVAEMFSAGPEPVWHRLGQRTEAAVTSGAALKLAGLDWTVEARPLFAPLVDRPDLPGSSTRELTRIPSHAAIVRADTEAVLGVVGRRYRPIQNEAAFDWLDDAVGERLAAFETAGSLKGGRIVWMQMRLPLELRVPGTDDVSLPLLLACNSHDGSRSFRVLRTAVRVVCSNTLTMSLRGGGGLVVRHTAGSLGRLETARRVLGLALRDYKVLGEQMARLAATPITRRSLHTYVGRVIPEPKRENARETNRECVKAVRDRIAANFDAPAQQIPGIAGSAWAAYNAVSRWADHERPVRGRDDRQRDERRLGSLWFGEAARLKQHAWDAALELAK